MTPDDQCWLEQVRDALDVSKACIESNGRVPLTDRVKLASDLETVFKQARALVEAP